MNHSLGPNEANEDGYPGIPGIDVAATEIAVLPKVPFRGPFKLDLKKITLL